MRKMVPKRLVGQKRTPTQIIGGWPVGVERAGSKRPREFVQVKSTVHTEYPLEVHTAYPKKGEKMIIHSHLGYKEQQNPLPSATDLRNLFRTKKIVKTSVVANKNRGEVSGYTFVRRKKGIRAFLKQWQFSIRRGMMKHNPHQFYEKYPKISTYRNRVLDERYIMPDGTLNQELFAKDILAAQKEMEQAGFKLRFVPNKNAGYIWNGTRFVKKEN